MRRWLEAGEHHHLDDTPWTLPASLAVAFHPDFEYVALESDGQVYIVAESLAKSVAEAVGFKDAKEIARFAGRKLERTTFQHPFSIAAFWVCWRTT